MKIIKCTMECYDRLVEFYAAVLKHLRTTVNYPKWSDEHPSPESIAGYIKKGEQYICLDGDETAGAFVLNENPEGDYGAGDWSESLSQGEYLVIHTLATLPDRSRCGVGGFMVEKCIEIAKAGGYRAIRLDVVPGNHPAAGLYTKNGFKYAGTKDLLRGYEDIPLFELYELIL